jgi:methanogenic corrinoid protein MtbC1
MEVLQEISKSLQQGKVKDVEALVQKALAEGLSAKKILDDGLLEGMGIIGKKFKDNEVFVPEVMFAASAMNAGSALLKPHLVGEDATSSGKVVLGTIKGDMHDIGKNLVRMMMEGKGLEVIDLGVNVSAQQFIDTAITENARVIACSALLTTTMGEMKSVVEAASAAGIRDKVKILIGGAPVTQNFCNTIGADFYEADAASGADAALEACKCLC